LLLNFNNLWYLYLIVDYLFDWDVSWDFFYDLYNSLNNSFMRNDPFLYSFQLNKFVNYFFNNSIDLDIHVLFNYYFLDFGLENWNLYNFFNFFDSLLNHKFRNHSLDDLRNLNNFLNNTRNNYNLFDNLFDLNYFGNLNHFFNDLFNWHFDLFDSINMPEYFNNFFLDIFDWFWHFNVVVDNLLDLNCLWFSDDNRIPNLDNNWHLPLYYLDNRLFNYFLNFYNPFMDAWNFNDSLHLLRNFFINFNNFSNYLLHLFDPINWD